MEIKSTLRRTIIVIAAMMIAGIAVISVSPYAQRYLMYPFRFGVYDYQYLPLVEIKSSGTINPYPTGTLPDSFSFTFRNNKIDNLDQFLESHDCNAFLILKNDTLIYEKYFNGHGPDTPCKVFSITKAYIATLTGIAIAEGYIGSVDDPLLAYIPELAGENREQITIRHCLDGKSGLKYVKGVMPWYDQPRMYYTTDVRELLSGVELERLPGVDFGTDDYSPLLLGMVLERATGIPVETYFQKKIWEPLKTGTSAWLVLDSEENRFVKGESGLIARPLDVLRFGHLYLKGGKMYGTQIIPADWFLSTTRPDTSCEYYKGEYYHNMWWGILGENGEYTYSANGHFSQRLYISPGTRTVVIRFGTDNAGVPWGAFLHSLVKAIDSQV